MAIPSNITIGYNENVTIEVGVVDMTTGTFEPPFYLSVLTARYLSFSAEFPDGNPGAWFVHFDPPLVYQNPPDGLLKTSATISLSSPPIATNPIQNTLIRIKITDVWVTGNFYWPKDQPGYESLFMKLIWFAGAFTGGYGKYSGKILSDDYYVDVIVNVKPYHAVKIQGLPPDKLAPSEIATIPVLVQNLGNYKDTFNFRFTTDAGVPLTATDNNSITLEPGEQGQAFIAVAAPANILDTGTLHSIILDAFSVEQPDVVIASQRLFVETQGIYLSEINIIYTILLGCIILLGISLLLYRRQKHPGKNGQKPQKPWTIPEEKQHLQELKRLDHTQYEQERLMMEDEYKSALLFYDDYKESLKKKPKEKKPVKKQKSTQKKPLLALLKKPLKKTKKQPTKKPKEKPIKKPIAPPVSDKDKALAKIRSQQEKQLRRMSE